MGVEVIRGKSSDFWAQRRMQPETKHYVSIKYFKGIGLERPAIETLRCQVYFLKTVLVMCMAVCTLNFHEILI